MKSLKPLKAILNQNTNPIIDSITLSKLDFLGYRVLQYLNKILGTSKIPKCVPLLKIAKACSITYKQARNRIDTLVKLGYIDRWTETHQGKTGLGSFRRTSYYRTKYNQPTPRLL